MTVLTRKRTGALATALLVSSALLLAPAAYAAEAPEVNDDPISLDTGHIDAFNLALDTDDSVLLTLKEDVTGSHVVHTPESVSLVVKEQAKVSDVPASAVPDGLPSSFYHLPITQDPDLIWPGWDSQAVASAYGSDANVDIAVTAVDGPGDVFLWSQDSFGQVTSLLTGDGYSFPGTIHQDYLAHVHANWAFTAAGTYHLTAQATVTSEDGSKTSTSNTATYTFVVGDAPAPEPTPDPEPAPAQTVTIDGVSDHYHSGSPIELTAAAEPAVEGATYRWSVQRTDQSEPAVLGGSGSSFTLTAEQAFDGAIVRADLLQGDTVLASAEPVTIHVDDHGAAPLQTVTVTGLAEHYHTGDTVTLQANVDPASALTRYAWSVQTAGSAEPTLVEGANAQEYAFEATEDLAGAAVSVALTYDDGTVYVASEPVIVQIEDHHVDVPATELSIQTNREPDDYWVGQTAELTAVQSNPTGLTDYVWLTKLPGEAEFTTVDGETANLYEFKPTLENSGIEVKVQLRHDGEVHAESAPVTITAQRHDPVTTLTVSADKDAYAVGDVAHLTSAQNPVTEYEHYHWYVKKAGESDFVWVDQSRDADLDYPVTAEDDGAQLVLRLFDEDHATIAESDPITIQLTEAAPQQSYPQQDEPQQGQPQGDEPRADSLVPTGGDVAGLLAIPGLIAALLGAAAIMIVRRRSGGASDSRS